MVKLNYTYSYEITTFIDSFQRNINADINIDYNMDKKSIETVIVLPSKEEMIELFEANREGNFFYYEKILYCIISSICIKNKILINELKVSVMCDLAREYKTLSVSGDDLRNF